MSKRRTAEDALKMTPNVVDFISGGVPSAEKQKAKPEQPEKVGKPTKAMNATDGPKRNTKPRNRVKTPDSSAETIQPSLAYDRTLAQARIQKSVRFLPQLIAQFEDYCIKELQAGRKPPSLQDALNEAFRAWLT